MTEYVYLFATEQTAGGTATWLKPLPDVVFESEAIAKAKVERALTMEGATVHCPSCGKYQRNMIADVQRQAVAWTWFVPFGVAAVGVFICTLFGFGIRNASYFENAIERLMNNWVFVAAAIAAGITVKFAIEMYAKRIDVNSDAASRVGVMRASTMLRADFEMQQALAKVDDAISAQVVDAANRRDQRAMKFDAQRGE